VGGAGGRATARVWCAQADVAPGRVRMELRTFIHLDRSIDMTTEKKITRRKLPWN
jgi:hypothetical protein